MVPSDSLRREHAWVLLGRGAVAVAMARAVGMRTRRTVVRGFGGLVLLDVVVNAPMARRILDQARQVARERAVEQRKLDQAQLAERYSAHHQVLSQARTELRALLSSELPSGAWKNPATRAADRLDLIGLALRETRAIRDALVDVDGRLPVIGGHAARVETRPDEQMSFHGGLEDLRRRLPWPSRRLLHQARLIMEEVRLLHNAEIEVAVLRFTLISRAILVASAPFLGDWTFAKVPLHGASTSANTVWGISTFLAVITALRAETVVDTAMTDSAHARRFRWRLLGVELPVSAVGLLLCPAWPVAVFASGWTNWWQRQTAHLRFDWTKLAIFVLTVVGLQQVGLALEGVAQPAAAGETAITLFAILVLGASYGAMLPLTIATIVDLVVDDGSRQLRADVDARDQLLKCARDLQATADTLQGLVRSAPAASRASATAAQAARALERAADRAARRAGATSQVLGELVNEAAIRSFLLRHETTTYEHEERRTAERGESPPAYIGGQVFTPRTLRAARVRRARDARRVRAVLECALNEAASHGTGGVRVLVTREDERLRFVGANQTKQAHEQRSGLAGEGAHELRRLAERLPDGHLDTPPAWGSASDAGLPGDTRWWIVSFSCDAAILEAQGQGSTR